MKNNTNEIITDYYTELQKAFRTKQLDFSKLHLADNIRVIGPNESFEGKAVVEAMYAQFIQIMTRFDIKHQYIDQDSACTILDCVTSTPAGSVLTAEWLLVKEGRIVEIYPIYDSAAWAKVNA